jgi:hypothetical protein
MLISNIAQLWRQLPELGFDDAALFLSALARDPAFLGAQILPLLLRVPSAPEPYIGATFGAREATNCLQVFVWPAGATTAIHDHTSWGAYHCVVGALVEERYQRLDDGAQPSHAHLRRLWRRTWRRADGASLVGAYEQGIHRVANPSPQPALSLHLYGPRVGSFDGRDYDPRHDTVCDRLEQDDVPALRV